MSEGGNRVSIACPMAFLSAFWNCNLRLEFWGAFTARSNLVSIGL
jgi:hypothetical protein